MWVAFKTRGGYLLITIVHMVLTEKQSSCEVLVNMNKNDSPVSVVAAGVGV